MRVWSDMLWILILSCHLCHRWVLFEVDTISKNLTVCTLLRHRYKYFLGNMVFFYILIHSSPLLSDEFWVYKWWKWNLQPDVMMGNMTVSKNWRARSGRGRRCVWWSNLQVRQYLKTIPDFSLTWNDMFRVWGDMNELGHLVSTFWVYTSQTSFRIDSTTSNYNFGSMPNKHRVAIWSFVSIFDSCKTQTVDFWGELMLNESSAKCCGSTDNISNSEGMYRNDSTLRCTRLLFRMLFIYKWFVSSIIKHVWMLYTGHGYGMGTNIWCSDLTL